RGAGLVGGAVDVLRRGRHRGDLVVGGVDVASEAQAHRRMNIGRPSARRFAALVCVVAVLVVGAIVGAWWVWPSGGANGPPRAVIVDQLALTDENSVFVDEASQLLADAGYQVDYVPQTNVTVDFYRGLAKRGYS